MASRGVRVDASALRARIADADGGVLLADSACVSWALDGGVLHLYDFALAPSDSDPPAAEDVSSPNADDLPLLLEAANRTANGRFAAVIATTLWADDPVAEQLKQNGFDVDWDEADVRNGQPARLVGLVREVT